MMMNKKRRYSEFFTMLWAICFVALILLQCNLIANDAYFLENAQGLSKISFFDIYEPSAQMEDQPQSFSSMVEMKYGNLSNRSFKLILQNWFYTIREAASLILIIYIATFVTFFVLTSSRKELIVVHLRHGEK